MTNQDHLMNFIQIRACGSDDHRYDIVCSDCGVIADTWYFDEANNAKIDHENQHGIFLDTIMGEGLYYDPEEDQYAN